MELGTQQAAARESASLITGDTQPPHPSQKAWDCGALLLPGLQGSPHPYRPREAPSLPVRGHLGPHPANGAVTHTGCQLSANARAPRP